MLSPSFGSGDASLALQLLPPLSMLLSLALLLLLHHVNRLMTARAQALILLELMGLLREKKSHHGQLTMLLVMLTQRLPCLVCPLGTRQGHMPIVLAILDCPDTRKRLQGLP